MPADTEPTETATGAPGEAADPSPAPVALYGFLPGFEAGVKAGYEVGRRDLEREKSEASAAGFRRGRQAAETFLAPATARRINLTGAFSVAALGVALGMILEQRRQQKQIELEEGESDDVPDVRD